MHGTDLDTVFTKREDQIQLLLGIILDNAVILA